MILTIRTSANREEQVVDFVASNVQKKRINVFSLVKAHGLRSYVFIEADNRQTAEEAFHGVPYAKGLLPKEVKYEEIEQMLEPVKTQVNIQKNDIIEIITGPFTREKARVNRINLQKEEVIVELLEAAVPIPITLRLDAIRVIRRDEEIPEENAN